MTKSANTSPGEFIPIFSGGRSLFGLRVLGILSIVVWAGGLHLAWDIFNSFGLNPADGYDGQLAPLSHRIGIATTLAMVVSSFFFYMGFMAQQVVTKIHLSKNEEMLRIQTIGFWNWRGINVPSKYVISVTEVNHQAGTSTVTVPRLKIRIRDRKWSLWIQMPGKVLDENAFRKHLLRKKGGR